jgi:hypothetical protein
LDWRLEADQIVPPVEHACAKLAAVWPVQPSPLARVDAPRGSDGEQSFRLYREERLQGRRRAGRKLTLGTRTRPVKSSERHGEQLLTARD